MSSLGERLPAEVTSLPVSGDPPGDPVYGVGVRRLAVFNGLAVVGALAAVLALVATLIVQLAQNRYVPAPVLLERGLVVARDRGVSIADKVAFSEATIIEKAKQFAELCYMYEFRAGGRAKLIACASMVPRDRQDAVGFPTVDATARLDANQTDMHLVFTDATVRYLAQGIFEVTLKGERTLTNLQYPRGAERRTPFVQQVSVQRVIPGARGAFWDGLAVIGAKGDLDW